MAAPAFGAAGTVLAGASSGTAAVPVPSGVTSGQIVFVLLYLEANRTITPPAGFTLLGGANAAASNHWSYVYWKRATGSDSGTYTFTFTSTFREAVAIRVTGAVDTGDPVDVFSKAARSTSGTVTPAVSVTTTGVDRLLLWFGTDFSTGSWTPPSGFTERVDASSEITAATKTQAAAGASGSITGTSTGSNQQTAWLVAVLPASTDQSVTMAAGIPTAEAFGAGSVSVGPTSTTSDSVPSAESFGLGRIDQIVSQAAGISTAESVPPSTIIVSGAISSDSIPSAESFGPGAVAAGPVAVTSGSIPTAESVPATSALRLNVSAPSIPSAEQVPGGVVTVGTATVTGGSIPSAEAFGAGVVLPGPVSVTSPSIPSAEVFGPHRVSMTLYSPSIPSAEQVPGGALVVSAVFIYSPSIPSGESFGFSSVVVTVDTSVRGLRPSARLTPKYELLVMGRIPQPSGPPAFQLADPIDWTKLRWGTKLSKAQSLSVTCKRSSITEDAAQRVRNPHTLPTELWLLRNGRQVLAGPLLGAVPNGEEVTFVAGGLLTYLEWMITLADKRFDQADQFAIAAWLIDQWQSVPYFNFGIDTSQVGASGKLRDREYVRNEQNPVAKRLEELGAVRDGFDAEIEPATRQLTLWAPTKGVDRSSGEDSIVFDGRSIDGNDGLMSISPTTFGTVAFGSSTASGSSTTLWSEQRNEELVKLFGGAAITDSWSNISEQATLDDHVASLRDAHDQPLRAPARKVRVTPDTDLDRYDVGDTVDFQLDPLLGIGGAYRIRSRDVSVEETTGEELVDLEFA